MDSPQRGRACLACAYGARPATGATPADTQILNSCAIPYSVPILRSPAQPSAAIPMKESELMPKELSEYTITAKLLNTYEIKVMATDEVAALESLDEWVAEDFEDFKTNQQWDFEAI